MNKTLKTVLCLVLVLGSLLCLSACGGETSSAPTEPTPVKLHLTGRYEIESIEWASGTVSSGEILEEALDAMGDMYVELYSDGTAQLCMYGSISDMEFNETEIWNMDADYIKYEISINDGKLTLKDGEDIFNFVKQ